MMAENLNKKPAKGILKSSSSFDTASCGASSSAAGVRRNSGVPGQFCDTLGNSSSNSSSVSAGACCGVVAGSSASTTGNCSRQSSNELTVEGFGVIGGGGGGIGGGGDCCGGDNGEEYVHVRKHSKTAKFDEMNILETYHPATKTYGHMKIEEPKTPFNYYEEDEADVEGGESSQSSKRRSKEINADELLRKLEECKEGSSSSGGVVGAEGGAVGGISGDESSDEEEEDGDGESKAARVKFESKRKAHYNEYYAVKLARKLMEQEEDDDEEDEGRVPDSDDDEDIREAAPHETCIPDDRDNGERMVTDQDG